MTGSSYKQRSGKYNAVRTEGRTSDGGYRKFDSKFEAAYADELYLRLKAGEIKDYECQFMVEMVPYDKDGEPVPKLKVKHKIDFCEHNLDGSFMLTEIKGMELSDWRRRRDWLTHLWLPTHPEYEYQVIKQKNNFRGWKR